MRKRHLVVLGTRPEAIKLAPLINELRRRELDTSVCATGQHREMLDQALSLFEIMPDHDLAIMRPDQDLTDIVTASLEGLTKLFRKQRFDRVIVQGDTTTTFAASLAAFYAGIPVAHVEAGLRTGDFRAPWPEEMNRVLTSVVAELHFCPTEAAKQNLLREGISPSRIHVTGNTVIDALLDVRKMLEENRELRQSLDEQFSYVPTESRLIVVTGHRRENFGDALEQTCLALQDVASLHPDLHVVYPVHLNPNVQEPVHRLLGANSESEGRVHLIAPVDYVSFVYLMNRSTLIITDSGGVQEEAPSLGKPVLVTRTTTERPEAVDAGTVLLVGSDRKRIVEAASRLLTDSKYYQAMSTAHNPYGDGTSSRKIADILEEEK